MASIYTTADKVKAYGDYRGGVHSSKDDSILSDELIPGYCEAIDEYCGQQFLEETVVSQVRQAIVDADGLLTCYPPFPKMAIPTSFEYRYGAVQTWSTIAVSKLDVEEHRSGSVCRVYGNYASIRGQRISVRLSYVGGYVNIDALPNNFTLAATQLVYWGLKVREAPIAVTATADYGQVTLPPKAWPPYVKAVLNKYRRDYPY